MIIFEISERRTAKQSQAIIETAVFQSQARIETSGLVRLED